MGQMGCGYGSEFHLLRYLGYHRNELNRAIEKETSGRIIDWRDFRFDARGEFPHLDAELKGIEFLPPEAAAVKTAWEAMWPQTGNVPNWDAVGALQLESTTEYILIEAKAHAAELRSNCGAREDGGLRIIREAFARTIEANGFESDAEKWLRQYYQYANRLAFLQFLMEYDVAARLVLIYFTGDEAGRYKKPVLCPKNRAEWEPHLKKMYEHLGARGSSKLEQRVHRLFLPICGQACEKPDRMAA
jgi:hypothetical protein